MGRNGRDYVQAHYRWNVILGKYDRLIGGLTAAGRSAARVPASARTLRASATGEIVVDVPDIEAEPLQVRAGERRATARGTVHRDWMRARNPPVFHRQPTLGNLDGARHVIGRELVGAAHVHPDTVISRRQCVPKVSPYD